MDRLPGYRDALIADEKLRYCLDQSHPVGQHKARVFASALGLGPHDTAALRSIICDGVAANPGVLRYTLMDGAQRWVVRWKMLGRTGIVVMTTVWNVEGRPRRPRLISCYLRSEK